MAKIAQPPQSILTLASRSTSGQSSGYNTSRFRAMNFFVVVTAITGSGAQLTPVIKASPDNTDYFEIKRFTAITAAGNYIYTVTEDDGLSRYTRFDYEITGSSPSVTFRVSFCGQEEY